MKKILLSSVFALLCALPAQAQNSSRYSFDNFDTEHGIRVATTPTTETRPTGKGVQNRRRATSAARTQTVAYVPPKFNSASGSSALGSFTTGNAQVDRLIVESGERNGVDPALLYAIMHQESSFKQRAVSHKGASGLMQLMPGTAARFGVRDRFDPRQNIEGGAKYMRFLLNFFDGDVRLALAGYNAGEGAVLKYRRSVPPYRETQEYVRRITRRYALMRDPQIAQRAQVINTAQVAAIQEQTSVPISLYERSIYAVRLPDGRLQLVSQ